MWKKCLKMFKNIDTVPLLLNRNYYFMKSAIIIATLISSIVFTNVHQIAKVSAESGIGTDVFKVVVSLFGITNSTKDVLTMVNVDDQTKIKLFNAEDPANQGQDKVSYTMTFPGTEVQDGDPYTVCTMSTDNFQLECQEGNNSPLNRPEFVDINVGEGSSSNKEKNGTEQND